MRGKDHKRQHYATLSHCWGPTKPLSTLAKDIDAFQTVGIRWEQLPKTFQDAIETTRRLSLRYIWIDSLCIVQDDVADWRRESALMGQVYSCAFVAIAAADAKTASEGCFRERSSRAIWRTETSIQWSNCTEIEASRYVVVTEPQAFETELECAPLHRRAWVFQERLLSRRVLSFAKDQLSWECVSQSASETYPEGLPHSLGRHALLKKEKLQLCNGNEDDCWPANFVSSNPPGGSYKTSLWKMLTTRLQPYVSPSVTLYASRTAAPSLQVWDDVVESYSTLSLTYDGDKLMAIAGVAMAYSKYSNEAGTFGDGYLAGIWQSSLPTYLLWTTAEREPSRSEKCVVPLNTHSRPKHYIAPSWSWASMIGRVSLEWCQSNYHRKDYLTTVEDASVTHRGDNRFGQVLSGYIKLSGPTASILWKHHCPPLDYNVGRSTQAHARERRASLKHAKITHLFPRHLKSAMSVSVPPRPSSEPEIFFDTITEDKPPELALISLIGIPKRGAHGSETVIGLVLKPSERSEEFVRVGVFYTVRLQVGRMLRNMPRQSITIV